MHRQLIMNYNHVYILSETGVMLSVNFTTHNRKTAGNQKKSKYVIPGFNIERSQLARYVKPGVVVAFLFCGLTVLRIVYQFNWETNYLPVDAMFLLVIWIVAMISFIRYVFIVFLM